PTQPKVRDGVASSRRCGGVSSRPDLPTRPPDPNHRARPPGDLEERPHGDHR
ncbi:unnamed protein product, partial [Musa hybrid cultivar]